MDSAGNLPRLGRAVLTYGGLFLFPRTPGQSWSEALAAEPTPLPPFDLPQAEAAGFAADGRQIYVASENTRQLLRYDREPWRRPRLSRANAFSRPSGALSVELHRPAHPSSSRHEDRARGHLGEGP